MNRLTREAVDALRSPLAARVELHEEIGSTQERARELALGNPGAPHGTLVVSMVQTGGRGRLGRSWGSPAGGLWMSLVLRPNLTARLAPRVTQTAAVAVAKALWEIGVEARIKWPNDLLVDGRKICGILAEASLKRVAVAKDSTVESRLDFVILGVGLNANLDPRDLGVADREVATLRSELGRDVSLPGLLQSLLSNLEAEFGRMEDFAAVLEDWRMLNCTLGERVRVRRFDETVEGRAVDLGPEGALLLETRDGTIELFEGEVEFLRREEVPGRG